MSWDQIAASVSVFPPQDQSLDVHGAAHRVNSQTSADLLQAIVPSQL